MAGKVYLVGAGPGDPELMTVKAKRLLDEADVVMYDSLTGDEIVDAVPRDTRLLDVGKKSGADGARTTQADINHLLVRHAKAGRTVVRLKGGDPTVFGRGGEEAEHLASAEVPFEIVPGVSSVVAGPGSVGIPLTHREHASTVTVVTGHEAPRKDESALDWPALARTVRAGGTLLILMGVKTLPANVRRLREAGLSAETPAALIEKATWAEETTVTGTLETIVAARDEAEIEPPAVTVIGDVVGVRERVAAHLARDTTEHGTPPRSRLTGLSSDTSLGPPLHPVPENS